MRNHDDAILRNMVFTLPHSFGQLFYLGSDCNEIIEKKAEIEEIDKSKLVVYQRLNLTFPNLIVTISYYLNILYAIVNFNRVLVERILVNNDVTLNIIPLTLIKKYWLKKILTYLLM